MHDQYPARWLPPFILTLLPIRQFLSTIAFLIKQLSPIPSLGISPFTGIGHFFKCFIIITAHEIAVNYCSTMANPGSYTNNTAFNTFRMNNATIGCERIVQPRSTDFRRGQHPCPAIYFFRIIKEIEGRNIFR